MLLRWLVGVGVSALIAWAAWRRGSLSSSGVVGALLTGTLVFGCAGALAGVLLIAFFVSSSLLSHFKEGAASKRRAAALFDKGGRRDLGQALANGGAAALAALLAALPVGATASRLLAAALVGALATVNADTWATELGVLNRAPPRLITHLGRTVPPGTSGGVSLAGNAAALAGATFLALLYAALSSTALARPPWTAVPLPSAARMLLVIPVAGLCGALTDSLLGATVQRIHLSRATGGETERAFDPDGTRNEHLRGWRWMSNDAVNFLASVAGATLAATLTAF
jgi:uncharacterized protein (TIGR00297 family)